MTIEVETQKNINKTFEKVFLGHYLDALCTLTSLYNDIWNDATNFDVIKKKNFEQV